MAFAGCPSASRLDPRKRCAGRRPGFSLMARSSGPTASGFAPAHGERHAEIHVQPGVVRERLQSARDRSARPRRTGRPAWPSTLHGCAPRGRAIGRTRQASQPSQQSRTRAGAGTPSLPDKHSGQSGRRFFSINDRTTLGGGLNDGLQRVRFGPQAASEVEPRMAIGIQRQKKRPGRRMPDPTFVLSCT